MAAARQRTEGLEQELHSAWDAAQAQRQRMAALQEDLQRAWAEAQEQRHTATALAQEVGTLRAKLAGTTAGCICQELKAPRHARVQVATSA